MKTGLELSRPRPRDGRQVMRPESLAAIQPSALSGARAMIAKMTRERWDITNVRFDVDADAVGTVVYSIKTPRGEFSFIGFSKAPSGKARTGRIIGQAWDMMGTLNEGPATDACIESARAELPKLYTGRATPNALIWCRSNRSMRVFASTMEALMEGRQPSVDELANVCYLMRNTGLDGNGTFGTRSYPSLGKDHPLGGVLQAQLLTGYMMREFSCDLVDHLARLRSDKAVPLSPDIRRYLGVGNGSALGLIFYVHRHPRLLNAWIGAREQLIAKARGLDVSPSDARLEQMIALVERAILFRKQDRMRYEAFAASADIAEDLESLLSLLVAYRDTGRVGDDRPTYPFDAIAARLEGDIRPESLETYFSLLIELVPDETVAEIENLSGRDEFTVQPAETIADVLATIESDYGWALEIDMQSPDAYAYIWYKSETAEEPRRGARNEAADALDLGLDICGMIQALKADIAAEPRELTVARFLMKYPQHRYMVARVQGLRGSQYHTPMANINAEDFLPIDLVRLMNVGFHGIDKTKDYLNRNLRGVLFHGAPTPDDLRAGHAGTWFYPAEPRS